MSEEYLLILINLIVVPLLVQLYKLAVNQFGWTPGRIHISAVLSVVAVGLSYVFGQDFFAGLPPFSNNFLEFALALFEGLGALVGAAVLLYNVLTDKFFDGIKARFKSFVGL